MVPDTHSQGRSFGAKQRRTTAHPADPADQARLDLPVAATQDPAEVRRGALAVEEPHIVATAAVAATATAAGPQGVIAGLLEVTADPSHPVEVTAADRTRLVVATAADHIHLGVAVAIAADHTHLGVVATPVADPTRLGVAPTPADHTHLVVGTAADLTHLEAIPAAGHTHLVAILTADHTRLVIDHRTLGIGVAEGLLFLPKTTKSSPTRPFRQVRSG